MQVDSVMQVLLTESLRKILRYYTIFIGGSKQGTFSEASRGSPPRGFLGRYA